VSTLIVRLAQARYASNMEEPRDVRLPLMVTKTEAEAIDAWRYANKVPSRAEAIRQLIALGLTAKES
jgi:hypothetical protein